MKKMFPKIKKFLKSNQLLSKISCIVVCLTILLSTFSVSIFAAEGDGESTTTESITDVWTSVTDSIMSLFGSAQGLFLSGTIPIDPFTMTISEDPIISSLYSVAGAPSGFVDFYVSEQGVDGFVIADFDPSYDADLGFYGAYLVSYQGHSVPCLLYSDGSASILGTVLPQGYYTTFTPTEFSNFIFYSNVSTGGLSFLGILAVLGLGLSLFFLLVMVIIGFIRLRG